MPGESHGWRRLVGYSLWGCRESDTTEQLMQHTHSTAKHPSPPLFSSTCYRQVKAGTNQLRERAKRKRKPPRQSWGAYVYLESREGGMGGWQSFTVSPPFPRHSLSSKYLLCQALCHVLGSKRLHAALPGAVYNLGLGSRGAVKYKNTK